MNCASPLGIADGLPDPLPFEQIPRSTGNRGTGGAQGRVAVESALRRQHGGQRSVWSQRIARRAYRSLPPAPE
ncbi:hypothetical protein [Rhodococcus sp. ACS1]|uniref:hypothetical protein n=1 Tax=Rhodococcus sp. ACS1 TaxID=2028570 RepID=UPI001C52805F|nr:hypothetical protein [Rhodococcus sp. ACS1]